MDAEQLRAHLAYGREKRSVEYKSGGARTDKNLCAKVLRAMMAMANKRDGGDVVIGVDDDGSSLKATGISIADRDTWRHDDLASSAINHADPPLTFDTRFVELDGKWFVCIEVQEFERQPVLCKKELAPNGKVVLRNGACYIRGTSKMETIEVPSSVEMRELIELAVEKETRLLLRRLGFTPGAVAPAAPTDEDRFAQQVRELK